MSDKSKEKIEASLADGLTRRQLLKGAAFMSAGAMVPGFITQEALGDTGRHSEKYKDLKDHNIKTVQHKEKDHHKTKNKNSKPNILFIIVDEMRFPKVFPTGINSTAEFLKKFMPNTHDLWDSGVKFANHHTASNDCSPARGVLVTGLYSQQTWLLTTIIDLPTSTHPSSPQLQSDFPTYGKLLQAAGYDTPYCGKWHLSVPHQINGIDELSRYGFQGLTNPDPTGYNLQGTYGDAATGYLSDNEIATTAVAYLSQKKITDTPWCLTVGFMNPHDKQFFPAGTEYQTYTKLFANKAINPNGLLQYTDYSGAECGIALPWNNNDLANPPSYGYPIVPPNWESLAQLQANKPSYQTVARQLSNLIWGGISDNTAETGFSIEQYPTTEGYSPSTYGISYAPFNYWQRSLDCYTQLMEIVDIKIGEVTQAMSPEVASNTIIVFTSDHGDYASAHGFVSGKTGAFYDEAIRVPLIVNDPTGRFTQDSDVVRKNLTSSVDIMPMLVSLAHDGSRQWMAGDLVAMYGGRHDMISMLRSGQAPGRKYALYAHDEVSSPKANFLKAPWHITGVITQNGKLGVYSNWDQNTTTLTKTSQEIEYYDYSTPLGVMEINNTATSKDAKTQYTLLMNHLIPNELQKPLPLRFRPAQELAKQEFETFYSLLVDSVPGN
ncbi:MAG: sulfatase-like hydrolase/transferase [Methylococcaceae bacterium]